VGGLGWSLSAEARTGHLVIKNVKNGPGLMGCLGLKATSGRVPSGHQAWAGFAGGQDVPLAEWDVVLPRPTT
jgi:hypothetical protein